METIVFTDSEVPGISREAFGGWLEALAARLSLNSTGPTRTPTPTRTFAARAAGRLLRRARPVQLADKVRGLLSDERFSSRGCPLGMRACTRLRVLNMINYRAHIYKITR